MSFYKKNVTFNTLVDTIIIFAILVVGFKSVELFFDKPNVDDLLPMQSRVAQKERLADQEQIFDFESLQKVSFFHQKNAVVGFEDRSLPITNLNLSLHGVRINGAGQSSAIIRLPTHEETSYVVGDEVLPGVKLDRITKDHVVLVRSGRSERLYLDGVRAKQ